MESENGANNNNNNDEKEQKRQNSHRIQSMRARQNFNACTSNAVI